MNQDLYCTNCGEPWHWSSYTNEFTADERHKFNYEGWCPACKGKPENSRDTFRSMVMSAARDVMGDDIDGMVSAMDDAEHMFGEEFWA